MLYLLILLISSCLQAMQPALTAQEVQRQAWERRHVEATSAESPTPEMAAAFNKLAVTQKPQPEAFQLYLRSDEDEEFVLVKDVNTEESKGIRLFGTNERQPSYVSHGPMPSPGHKEAFVAPPTTPFTGKHAIPTRKSDMYPEGCYTYYYTLPSGKELTFARGHGISRVDTRKQPGTNSNKDADNYVPQNSSYNTPVRRDKIEAAYRDKKILYKEISIFHRDCMYEISINDKRAKGKHTVPVPEGFLVLAYDKEGLIKESYYFPNFIDYDELGGKADELFRLDSIDEWFFVPAVTQSDIDGHRQQINLAETIVAKLLYASKSLFKKLTEKEMPPKARVAFLATLLEWNMQAAASLEFVDFRNQLALCYYYVNPTRIQQFDIRTEQEKKAAVAAFLKKSAVSKAAKDVVQVLNDSCSFEEMQSHLAGLISDVSETYRNSAFLWQTPDLWPKKTTYKKGTTIILECNILHINPHEDIKHLRELVGGYESVHDDMASSILQVVDARARKMHTSVSEKLGILRLYADYPLHANNKNRAYWEALLERDAQGYSLLELRKICDFYGYRNDAAHKNRWLKLFMNRLIKEPTSAHFKLIAEWCFTSRAIFLRSMEEAAESVRPAYFIGYQICKGLSFLDLNEAVYKEWAQFFEQKLGLTVSDNTQLREEVLISHAGLMPFGLTETGSNEEMETGAAIMQICKLFYKTMQAPIIPALCAKSKAGDPHAHFLLGKWHEEGRLGEPGANGIAKPDDKGAVEFYTAAAEKKYPAAQFALGLCFKHGKGVPKLDEMANHWFLLAAQNNHTKAQVMIGDAYRNGWKGKSMEEAKKWYAKAAASGDIVAQRMLEVLSKQQ